MRNNGIWSRRQYHVPLSWPALLLLIVLSVPQLVMGILKWFLEISFYFSPLAYIYTYLDPTSSGQNRLGENVQSGEKHDTKSCWNSPCRFVVLDSHWHLICSMPILVARKACSLIKGLWRRIAEEYRNSTAHKEDIRAHDIHSKPYSRQCSTSSLVYIGRLHYIPRPKQTSNQSSHQNETATFPYKTVTSSTHISLFLTEEMLRKQKSRTTSIYLFRRIASRQ